MVVFVPLTMMSYTTFPFLLLALHLADPENRKSWGVLIREWLWFCGCFTLAVGMIYGLNYLIIGELDVPLDRWRYQISTGLQIGTLSLSEVLHTSYLGLALVIGSGQLTLGEAILALGFVMVVVLWRQNKKDAVALIMVLATGTGALVMHMIDTRYPSNPRAYVFFWPVLVLLVLWVWSGLPEAAKTARDRVLKLAVLVLGFSMVMNFLQFVSYRPWQAETQNMAEALRDTPDPLFMTGNHKLLKSALHASVTEHNGVLLRIKALTGRDMIYCEPSTEACKDLDPTLVNGHNNGAGWIIYQTDQGTVLAFPRPLLTEDPQAPEG
ncbi:MAG: hypothetical protein HRU31_13445, partial [Rhodobacteraceae bacterium]|nr:hypothetical protein [Paracoccaceae bacterium]